MRFLIYSLQDPTTLEVRYVGRSSSGEARPKEAHSAHCRAWIAKLRRVGKRPIIAPLSAFADSTPDVDAVLNAAERYWIAEFRRRGCPLTNLTDGGEGMRGHVFTAESRERMRLAKLGSTHTTSDETRRTISAARRGKGLTQGQDAHCAQGRDSSHPQDGFDRFRSRRLAPSRHDVRRRRERPSLWDGVRGQARRRILQLPHPNTSNGSLRGGHWVMRAHRGGMAESMKCPTCKKAMIPSKENHHYRDCGLDYVVLQAITVWRCSDCGAFAAQIPRLDELHITIARAVAVVPWRLNGAEIRFLRKVLGFGAAEFARAIGTAPETVSRWEHGKKQMSDSLERFLRVMVFNRKPLEEYPLETLLAVPSEVPRPTTPKKFLDDAKSGWLCAAAS